MPSLIESITEQHANRTVTVGDDGRQIVREFHIRTRAATDSDLLPADPQPPDPENLDPVQILFDPLSPKYGDFHPHDAWSRITDISLTLLDAKSSTRDWRMRCTYRTPASARGNGSGGIENPLLAPPVVTFDFSSQAEPIDTDIWGNSISNSAGIPFDPGVMRETNDVRLTITRYWATYDLSVAQAYKDAVSSDEFMGRPAGSWKIAAITATSERFGAKRIWRVTVVMDLRAPQAGSYQYTQAGFVGANSTPPWWRRMANLSTLCKVPGQAELVKVRDANGNPIDEPRAIFVTDNEQKLWGIAWDFVSYRIYDEKPFADLPYLQNLQLEDIE